MQALIQLSEIVRNLGLALAAFGGLLLAWRRLTPEAMQAGSAALQAELARRAHVTELFNRAVGQLLDERLEVRLGAIYVLKTIGSDFPDFSGSCVRIASGPPARAEEAYGEADLPVDIRAIMEIVELRVVRNENPSNT